MGGSPPRSSPATPGVVNQHNVSRLVINGASNKETARARGISPSSVGTHVESVFRKLNCATRAAATLKALTAGLL